jgi:hypothetical protein
MRQIQPQINLSDFISGDRFNVDLQLFEGDAGRALEAAIRSLVDATARLIFTGEDERTKPYVMFDADKMRVRVCFPWLSNSGGSGPSLEFSLR